MSCAVIIVCLAQLPTVTRDTFTPGTQAERHLLRVCQLAGRCSGASPCQTSLSLCALVPEGFTRCLCYWVPLMVHWPLLSESRSTCCMEWTRFSFRTGLGTREASQQIWVISGSFSLSVRHLAEHLQGASHRIPRGLQGRPYPKQRSENTQATSPKPHRVTATFTVTDAI